MKERLLIFGGILLLIGLLIGINMASFSRKNQRPDSEDSPNRSSYNSDSTGTRALYELLTETGRKVSRWQEQPSVLLANGRNRPDTLVIIGRTRRPVSEEDAIAIMRWVSEGGKLVIIDRSPMEELIKTTSKWMIETEESKEAFLLSDPNDPIKLTDKVIAMNPDQPSVYTRGVTSIMPSRLASSIKLEYKPLEDEIKIDKFKIEKNDGAPPPLPKKFDTPAPTPKPAPSPLPESYGDASDEEYYPPPTPAPRGTPKSILANPEYEENEDEPPQAMQTPTPLKAKPPSAVKVDPNPSSESGNGMGRGRGSGVGSGDGSGEAISDGSGSQDQEIQAESSEFKSPVVHFSDENGALLADFPYGSGEVAFLSDPFIVANNGIKLADNSQLAINLIATKQGIIAFDEYHQGYGTNDSRLLAYFEGTPVLAIFIQIGLILGLFFWSGGRRFARALPLENPSRLSKLEYVGAMAEIQEHTRCYDLAIETIFGEFRRKLIRFAGADNTISNAGLANLISEKSSLDNYELLKLMETCVAIRQGEPTNKKEVLSLTKQIREIEEKLNLKRNKKR